MDQFWPRDFKLALYPSRRNEAGYLFEKWFSDGNIGGDRGKCEWRLGGLRISLSRRTQRDSVPGTFTEGHLKIEGGALLNQYFFSCDDNETWEVEKLPNSLQVPTRGPGKWSNLGENLWQDVEKLVTYLAYL